MLRLEGLTVQGFKSFADRTDLVFPDGITGVVGPNGCGKSNVVDSIAWVLGEQSARTLRGSKMEDVIFSGTRTRKPAGCAEVTLRFVPRPDTAQGEDVDPRMLEPLTVSRRLFRNGDSEYLINGERARLRDIVQLIMGTGMGTRVYSIVEQGRVEQILNSKPTDRRILIEEAAGITRYKLKRKAAKLKLDEAEQSLLRVTDIVAEIDKQLRSLKRQAGIARRYRRLAGRQRIVLRAGYAVRHDELRSKLTAAEEELNRLRAGEAESSTSLGAMEDALKAARERLSSLEQRRDQGSQRSHELHLELDRARHLVVATRERLSENDVRRKSSEQAVRRAEQEIAALTQRSEQCGAQLRKLDEELSRAGLNLEDFVAGAEAVKEQRAEAHRTVADSKESIFEVMSDAAGLRNRRMEVEGSLQRMKAHVGRLAEALAHGEAEASRGANELAMGEERLRKSTAYEDSLRARCDVATARLRDLGQQVERARADFGHATDALNDAERRLAAVSETVKTRAAYGEGVRRFLESSKSKPSTFADLITVERGDELACEKVLGPLLQAVVLDSQRAAEAAAKALLERPVGEVSFLYPPKETKRKAQPSKARPHARVLGSVRESVSFGAAHAWLSQHVPEAWIVAEAKDAMELASEHPEETFVSRDGALFGPGRVSIGRPLGEADGILEAKAKEATLHADAEKRRSKAAALKASLDALVTSQAEAAGEREEMQEALIVAEKEVLGGRHALIGLRQAAEAAEAQQATLRREHGSASEDLGEAEARIVECDRGLETCVERRAELERRLREATETAERLDASVLGRDADLSRLREELAVKGERREAARVDVAEAEAAVSQAKERSGRFFTEAESLRTQRSDAEALIARTEEAVASGAERWEALKVELAEMESELRTGRDGLVVEAERLRRLRADHESRAKNASENDVRRERLASDLEHLLADCKKELGVEAHELASPVAPGDARAKTEDVAPSSSDAESEGEGGAEDEGDSSDVPIDDRLPWVDGRLDVDALEKEAEKLRVRLSRIGPVNLVAIEEYEELAQRHGFLSTEQADLVSSIARLRETIAEIDEMSRERFLEAFEAIKVTFDSAFQTLFRGGRAELRLQDEGDPLECGIEIIAQPPGKRLQNMMLLSGGEKALSAIALLFALFRYKPSPFCILDEVDAPLDESNVIRFIELVEQLSSDTQFIVITHNRRTMERTDVLYGVTMEEPGCSKLVAVRFDGLRAAGSAA